MDKLFLKYVSLTPPPHPPKKTTLKNPSLIRVKFLLYEVYLVLPKFIIFKQYCCVRWNVIALDFWLTCWRFDILKKFAYEKPPHHLFNLYLRLKKQLYLKKWFCHWKQPLPTSILQVLFQGTKANESINS